jgi:hypothetical protein
LRSLGALLWIVPFAAHVGYVLATFDQLPGHLGEDGGTGGATALFIVEWFAVLGAANLAFTALHLRLPRLRDGMLSVPGRDWWLADPERRAELVDRLRAVCEVALLMLNVFFLAVYQSIYQTNTPLPILALPPPVLIAGFMLAPLLAVVAHLAWTLRTLARAARELHNETAKR